MSYEYLGKHIDIHTWWIEHIPVHHTNEIAQAEHSFCESPWVNYWFHLQHLQIDGTKISKSLWNVVYISDIIERWYSPWDVRYFFLTAHYRSFQDFTWSSLDAASKTRSNLVKRIAKYDIQLTELESHKPWNTYEAIAQALANDLDTIWALREIHQANLDDRNVALDILLIDMHVLRLCLYDDVCVFKQENSNIPDEIIQLAEERSIAKSNKDYQRADAIRDEIIQAGRDIRDNGDWYTISRK